LSIPFVLPFEQASKRRLSSESIQVIAERGELRGIGEGCPRPYQTGETQASALESIAALELKGLDELASLRERTSRRGWIDEHPAAWCAVETALLDLFAREPGCSVERLLEQPEQPRRFRYTTVIGIGFGEALLDRAAAAELRDFKLKVGLDLDADQRMLAAILQRIPEARVRLDVNNAFGQDVDAAIRHIAALAGALAGVWAIEEPLAAGQPERS